MPVLSPLDWSLLVVAAVAAGFSKTGVGGAGVVTAALAALVLPAREASGAVLPLLLVGDLVAVAVYRRTARWGLIARLLPWVLVGIGAGVALLVAVPADRPVRVVLGLVLLAMAAAHVLVGGRLGAALQGADAGRRVQHVAAAVAGVAVGFSTMLANAAGPVMTVYLLLCGVGVLGFMGTSAWFFWIVNLVKVPFSLALGLVDVGSLTLDLWLLPALAAGCLLGAVFVRRVDRTWFERIALGTAAVSAVVLVAG